MAAATASESAAPPAVAEPLALLHHRPEDEALAARLAERLRGLGIPVETRAAETVTRLTQTRFFRPADRVLAEALHASLLDETHGRAAAEAALDFGFYRPAPPEGRIELWIAAPPG